MSWRDWAEAESAAIQEEQQWRRIRDLDGFSSTTLRLDGRPVVSFAGNDYLGLASHPLVVGAAQRALERWGAGSGSARLLAGSRPIHTLLESELAGWKGCEAALLFPTGYATNLGVLTTFADENTLICSDELNHASIVDGCRLARGRVAVYPHNDFAALDHLLRGSSRAVVVSDRVFSMDGDRAPVEELSALCRDREALLVLDEAHAVLEPDVQLEGDLLRVGTLSKTLGSHGGFVAGPAAFVELIVNRARPFIFTTAAPAAAAAAALEALRILRSSEGERLKRKLRTLVERLAPGHATPIFSIRVGDERPAIEASRALLERGLFVPAIRPPSVPAGTARLRVSLSALHTEEQIDALTNALKEVKALVHA